MYQNGNACGQEAPTRPWFTTERFVKGGSGAVKRSSPMGGRAYRMLEKL